MRSIRLSLIVYFLSLMGLALSGVAYFCYQSTYKAMEANKNSTKDALDAKSSTTEALLTKQFEDHRAREIGAFNDKVLGQARTLARKAVVYSDRPELLSVGLGAFASQPFNGGIWAVVPPLAASTFPPFAVKLYQPRPPNIRLESPHVDEDPSQSVVAEGQFYQTYMPGKDQVLPLEHSRTLAGFVWKLEKETRSKADEGQLVVDEVKISALQTVRRVTMKINVGVNRRGLVIEPKLDGKAPDWFKLGPPPPRPGEDRLLGRKPSIYLQYGIDTFARDDAIAKLKADLDRHLAELASDLEEAQDKLESEQAESRLALRTRLLWIGMGAFAAVVVGGFWLVARGLTPLHRLSDAVSKVSEKDFRLPIDQDHLPHELKPIAGRLAATLDQLKRVFEREKQAAADISHELRTPVAALLTTLEITLRKPRSAEEYREVLQDCRDSGVQISQLVERLLTLARLDAGADMLRPRDVDVADLADQCVALVRPLAEARGLRLSVHHHGAASMHADPDKLREVLTNLLHNAIAYNKPHGSIDVQVERHNGTIDMEVRDTGIGIAPEARKRIFERFYRADPSRHFNDMGHAGLGLAIVKGYVDLMGGSIAVDSTEGAGSTFKVSLPAN
ncbi:MAG TPA: ATP-binding protein [Gemmataceae bacterium]|nr:ATP-binding protein [Gemmataceae bacterium]